MSNQFIICDIWRRMHLPPVVVIPHSLTRSALCQLGDDACDVFIECCFAAPQTLSLCHRTIGCCTEPRHSADQMLAPLSLGRKTKEPEFSRCWCFSSAYRQLSVDFLPNFFLARLLTATSSPASASASMPAIEEASCVWSRKRDGEVGN